MSRYYVYILRCADGSLYVGHTADVPARVAVHNDVRGASWRGGTSAGCVGIF